MRKVISLLSILVFLVAFTVSSFAGSDYQKREYSRFNGVVYCYAVHCDATYASGVCSQADGWARQYLSAFSLMRITTNCSMYKDNWSLITGASARVSNTSNHAFISLTRPWPSGASYVFTYGSFAFEDSTYGYYYPALATNYVYPQS